jgi:DNA-binding transcriptional LysR family regulator
MHYRRLDLNLLVALDALLEERSTVGAGSRLHLGQSATSAALARLREHFGDELLVQVGRKMVPTPLGESLKESVRDILKRIDITLDTKSDFVPATVDRTFTLMMSDYVATVFMPQVIQRVQPLAPKVSCEIMLLGDAPLDALNRGDLDFLILPTGYEFVSEYHLSDRHSVEVLFEDGYMCVVWSENPLVGDTISTEQFLSMGHVLSKVGKNRRPALDEWFYHRNEYVRRIELVAPSFVAMAHMIVGTTRIATMHTRLAKLYAAHFPLRLLPPPMSLPTLTEGVQWHSYHNQDPGTLWFLDVMKEVAKGMGLP